MAEIWHPRPVLWGERDGWIAPADLRTMAAAMPDCRLITVPGIGHSMNLEAPSLYAGCFGAWFGGVSGSEVRSSLALQVQFRQSYPVPQHDLPLRLAEEAKDAHPVKM